MKLNYVDNVLLNQIIGAAEKTFDSLKEDIDDVITDEKLTAIVQNVLNSKINEYISNKVNLILNEKMYKMVDEAIYKENELPIILKHEVSKLISSRDFLHIIENNLNDWVNKKFSVYLSFKESEYD